MKSQSHGPTRKILLIAGAVGIVAIILIAIFQIRLPGEIRRRFVSSLEAHFASTVEIQRFHVIVFPRIYVSAEGIVLRHNGRTDVPPLITIEKLTLSADLISLLRSPKRVASVHLDGLQIHVPPRSNGEPHADAEIATAVAIPAVVDVLTSDNVLLEILPNENDRLPRDFTIHRLVMTSVDFDRSSSFRAIVANSAPPGDVDSDGQFGPWNAGDPGESPLSATFKLPSADLASIPGLSGILSATGKYGGVLSRIDVDGNTETPRFALQSVGNVVPLTTHYLATVDGANGTTLLNLVEAHLPHSTITSSGEVTGMPGVAGRQVTFEVDSQDARVEDFLRLAVKGEPPMRGTVGLHLKLDVAAGDTPLLDRLSLDGRFGVAGATLTSSNKQTKLDSLSRSGQGQPKNEDIQNVISNLRGKFFLRKARLTFSNLTFSVPGASVELSGTYNVRADDIDLHGHLILDVKLSQATTGTKSVLLMFADSFFKKAGGGSSVPIKISGSRMNPVFSLDLHKPGSQR
jgi:hypothetical protein